MFDKRDIEQETYSRLGNALREKMPHLGDQSSNIARLVMQEFAVVEKDAIEFHEEPNGEWTAVYVYGQLAESPGDNYHADEFLQQLVGVITHQDSDFVLDDGHSAPDTLEELKQRQVAKAETAYAEVVAEAHAQREKAIAEAEANFRTQMNSL